MRRLPLILVSVLASTGLLMGCQRDDKAIGAKLDDISKDVKFIKENLGKGGGAAGAQPRGDQRPRPQPNDVYSVDITGNPYKGAEHAKVTIVEAFEFAWPFCQRVGPTLQQLLNDYKGEVKIVYKHFVVHPGTATIPAQASCAAAMQGKFGEFEDLIWAEGFPKAREGGLGQESMDKFAKKLELNMGKFATDMKECDAIVKRDQAQLQKVGTSGTPAFYINGRFLSGARPVEQFKTLVDEELKKANQRIQSGTKLEDYYTEWVVKKGKKSL